MGRDDETREFSEGCFALIMLSIGGFGLGSVAWALGLFFSPGCGWLFLGLVLLFVAWQGANCLK